MRCARCGGYGGTSGSMRGGDVGGMLGVCRCFVVGSVLGPCGGWKTEWVQMASQRMIEANRRNRAKRGNLPPEALQRLRVAALRNRPWEHATGPRTAEGKRRASMNSLKTGRYTAERRAWRRDALRFIRLDLRFRDVLLGRIEVEDLDEAVAELTRLAQNLEVTSRPSTPDGLSRP